jgi:hypothetical protein
MAAAKTNHLSDPARYVIRPALAEAKLMTEKHARDAVYVTTLTEELRNIERMIATMETSLELAVSPAPEGERIPEAAESSAAKWIRSKSGELDRRLRRIEQAGPSGLPQRTGFSHRSFIKL